MWDIKAINVCSLSLETISLAKDLREALIFSVFYLIEDMCTEYPYILIDYSSLVLLVWVWVYWCFTPHVTIFQSYM